MADHAGLVVLAMLVGGALVLTGVLAVVSWIWGGEPGAEPERPVAPPIRPAALRDEWQRLTAYASAAAARAAQARSAAAAARERSAVAETLRDAAWHEYETTERPQLVPAGAATKPADAGLAHAAFVAFRRGAISVRELQRVWGGRAETDPEREERRREAAARVSRERAARQAYHRAAAEARLAEEQARVAEVAAEALAGEAADAEHEARDAQQIVQRYLRHRADPQALRGSRPTAP
jgi:hypothetical protein